MILRCKHANNDSDYKITKLVPHLCGLITFPFCQRNAYLLIYTLRALWSNNTQLAPKSAA